MPRTPKQETPLDEMSDEQVAAQKRENATLERVGMAFTPESVPVDFDAAMRELMETGELVEFEGSPWHVVDKDELVGVPFAIMGYRVNAGSFGPFVSLMAVTRDLVNDGTGRKVDHVVINDGSTGIAAQWQELIDIGRAGRMLCARGLRVSNYEWTDDKGITHPAKTYYLA